MNKGIEIKSALSPDHELIVKLSNGEIDIVTVDKDGHETMISFDKEDAFEIANAIQSLLVFGAC